MNSPIVLFVYNRPEHTRRTLEALVSADESNLSPLIVFCDGPKTESDRAKVEAVREIVNDIRGFASVKVVERVSNYGLARNVIEGVTQVFEKYQKVIVLEDDLVVSKYFIHFMNSALNYYEGRGVFSVSGYTPNIEVPLDYPFTTYMIHRNCSWGWGTWKSKWMSVDWDVNDFGEFIHSGKKCRDFNQSGSDLTMMLLKQQTGVISSWSIRFCYGGFKRHEPTVYPVHSLVTNAGVDGSGTNMKSSDKYDVRLASYLSCQAFATGVAVNREILSSFRSFYDCSIQRRIINWFKLLLYRIKN